MSYQMAVAISSIGVVFFFAYMAWKFIDTSGDNAMHQGLGLGLMAASFVSLWTNTALMTEIVQEAAPANAGIINTLTSQYYITIIVGIIVMVYFGLLVMFGPMKAAIERKKLKI